MPRYTVSFVAYFSDSVEVEADNEDEAWLIGANAVADDWQAYSSVAGYTMPFDDISIEEVQGDEDEEEDD